MSTKRPKFEPEPGEDNLGTEPNPVPPRPPPRHTPEPPSSPTAPSSPSSPSSPTAPSIDWLGLIFFLLALRRDRKL